MPLAAWLDMRIRQFSLQCAWHILAVIFLRRRIHTAWKYSVEHKSSFYSHKFLFGELGKFSTPWNGFSKKCSPIMPYKNNWMMKAGNWTFPALEYFPLSASILMSHKILLSLLVYNFLLCWLHKFLRNFFFVSTERNFCLLSAKWNFKKSPFIIPRLSSLFSRCAWQKQDFLGSVWHDSKWRGE